MSPTLLDIDAIRRHLHARLLCSLPSAGKFVAFTFDDGPSPRNTLPLLELLARYETRATFFLVGRRFRAFPELVREITDAGHEIGNHGYHHLPMLLLPDRWKRRELTRTRDAIHDACGLRAPYFRPPMGWVNRHVLRIASELDYESVLGDVHPEDSRQPPVETLLRRVRRWMGEGSILLLHDGGWRVRADRSRTLELVELLMRDLLPEMGYEWGSIGQLKARSRAAAG